MLKSAVE